jgi:O-antigen ligase
MNYNQPAGESRSSDKTASILLSIVAACILLFPLFSLPGPSFVVGTPWKVELLGSFFMMLVAGWMYRSNYLADRLHTETTSRPSMIALVLIAAFAAWSLVSAVWADSSLAAVRHGLLWLTYVLVVLLVLKYSIARQSVRFVTFTLAVTAMIIFLTAVIDFVTVPDFKFAEGTLRIRYAKYAELLITACPLLAAVSLYRRGPLPAPIAAVAAGCGWVAAMLSLSKAAFIAGAIGFVFFFVAAYFLSGINFKRKIIVSAAGWLILTIAFQAFFSYALSVPATTGYITGSADTTRETSSMRIFTWKVALEMSRAHPVIGVGADNFGREFNQARADYAKRFPEDPGNATAEEYLVERSHNEYLQIAAELGLVGAGLFVAALIAFGFSIMQTFRRRGYRASPLLVGSIAGMTAFFISSLFTSFSFRAAQNGYVFFMLFGIALYELRKGKSSVNDRRDLFAARAGSIIFAAGAFGTILLAVVSGGKGISQMLVRSGEKEPVAERSYQLFDRALTFDPDNGAALFVHAARRGHEGDWPAAATLFRRSIDDGLGVTLTYSFLAESYSRSGNASAAEHAMAEAVRIFPHSVFARIRYALLLNANGKTRESEDQIDAAKRIDESQANGWHTIITEGSLAAVVRSQREPNVAAPYELRPGNAVYAYVDESERPPAAP